MDSGHCYCHCTLPEGKDAIQLLTQTSVPLKTFITCLPYASTNGMTEWMEDLMRCKAVDSDFLNGAFELLLTKSSSPDLFAPFFDIAMKVKKNDTKFGHSILLTRSITDGTLLPVLQNLIRHGEMAGTEDGIGITPEMLSWAYREGNEKAAEWMLESNNWDEATLLEVFRTNGDVLNAAGLNVLHRLDQMKREPNGRCVVSEADRIVFSKKLVPALEMVMDNPAVVDALENRDPTGTLKKELEDLMRLQRCCQERFSEAVDCVLVAREVEEQHKQELDELTSQHTDIEQMKIELKRLQTAAELDAKRAELDAARAEHRDQVRKKREDQQAQLKAAMAVMAAEKAAAEGALRERDRELEQQRQQQQQQQEQQQKVNMCMWCTSDPAEIILIPCLHLLCKDCMMERGLQMGQQTRKSQVAKDKGCKECQFRHQTEIDPSTGKKVAKGKVVLAMKHTEWKQSSTGMVSDDAVTQLSGVQ
eukprot:TRINITY_DN2315_c0_g2_i1.p1 TRINITY_DN2315_c0_g2~~TRINITY_DN2315_c0_g2_i1.p1  ORF type:complete len:476 (+),score=113.22 TRINITY_DN2315_c0_g2_i1:350-1777(+)